MSMGSGWKEKLSVKVKVMCGNQTYVEQFDILISRQNSKNMNSPGCGTAHKPPTKIAFRFSYPC